jgi:hypothetical protein
MDKYMAWSAHLRATGRHRSGVKLMDEGGKSLKVRDGKVVVDGPYAEAKECIGGFYIIAAESYEEALEIARAVPTLSYGGSVEVREVDPME